MVKNDKGRILVTTHQYTTLTPDAAAEPVVYVNLQGAQRPLVRYGHMHHIKWREMGPIYAEQLGCGQGRACV